MTISSTTNRVDYTGNSSTATYNYTFRIFDEDDLTVTVRHPTTFVETTLVIATDYTVTGVSDLSGGTIVLVNASQAWLTTGFLTTSWHLTIRRVRDLKQETDIRNQGEFFPETHEDAFDHFIMVDQQQQDELNRSIKTSETDSSSGLTIPIATERANKYLAFDSSGDPVAVDVSTSGLDPNFALVSSSSGFVEESIVTTTELAKLTGVGSLVKGISDSATLTNKTIDGDDNTVQDLALASLKTVLADASKFVERNASGVPVSNAHAVPTGVVVGTTDSQVLTNKTLTSAILTTPTVDIENHTDQGSTPSTPASGTTKIYSKTDGKVYKLTSAGVEQEIGTGSGSGVNYVTNPDFETATTGYATYADAAGASPVDGTGGSPTVTITRTTSSPLRSTGSGLITKDAANRQGEGVGYAFTIASADQAKVLNISFEYAVASGTFAGGTDSTTGDLNVYVYDVTNAVIIQPSSFKVLGSVSGQFYKHSATFQTASNSTSYRLIFHVASTSASAFTFKFDSVSVGPQIVEFGAPITDWVSYTGVVGATTSAPTFGTTVKDEWKWRRVGDSMEIVLNKAHSTAGSAGTGDYLFPLPTGYTIDTTKNSAQYIDGLGVVGSAMWDNGSSIYTGSIKIKDTTNLYAMLGNDTNAITAISSSVKAASNSTWRFSFTALVPITGWASSVVMSNDTDTRIVAAIITGDPASATSGNPIIVPTVGSDTHGGYNATTGRYTVPISGFYKVFGALQSASSATTLTIYKNAVSTQLVGNLDSNGEATFTGMVNCVSGDIIDVRPGGTVDATSMSLNIQRVSGPAAIAASESVTSRYYASATSISGSLATISWTTKDFDSHLGMSAGTYTVPVSGKYAVSTAMAISGTFALNNQTNLVIQKNGTTVSEVLHYAGGAITAAAVACSDAINCVAGDTLRVQLSSGATSPAVVSSNTKNFFSLERLGN